jgi:hypothetical protein
MVDPNPEQRIPAENKEGILASQNSAFKREQERIENIEAQAPTGSAGEQTGPKNRAVDAGFTMDPNIKAAMEQSLQQPDNAPGALPKELQAKLIENIANNNHSINFDAFDLTKISQGEQPHQPSDDLG